MKRNVLVILLAAFCAIILNSTVKASTQDTAITEQCHDLCVKSLSYLQKQDGKQSVNQIQTLRDCIKLCETNIDLSNRNSPLAMPVKKICAEACRRCAASCEELKDPHLAECVAICNSCAEHCEMHHK